MEHRFLKVIITAIVIHAMPLQAMSLPEKSEKKESTIGQYYKSLIALAASVGTGTFALYKNCTTHSSSMSIAKPFLAEFSKQVAENVKNEIAHNPRALLRSVRTSPSSVFGNFLKTNYTDAYKDIIALELQKEKWNIVAGVSLAVAACITAYLFFQYFKQDTKQSEEMADAPL